MQRLFVTTLGSESFFLQFVTSCIWAHKQLMEDAIEEWQSSAEDNQGDDLSWQKAPSVNPFPRKFDSRKLHLENSENDGLR